MLKRIPTVYYRCYHFATKPTPHIHSRYTFYLAFLVIFLSAIAFFINCYYQQYPGNNYLPSSTAFIALSLLLMYMGAFLQFGKQCHATYMFKETLYFVMVMVIIAFASNAVQYTPYASIDNYILALDRSISIDTNAVLAWTNTHPYFKKTLAFSYDTLPYQMSYIPLLFIVTGHFSQIREHYFLLLFATLLGFSFYYFFPTEAPASILNSPYFSSSQRDTSLKFTQIHHYIQPNTLDGGLIAFPSFHTIWAWFCLYLLRTWRCLFILLLPLNSLLVLACFLLGWHYLFDLVGSLIVILITHGAFLLIRYKEYATPIWQWKEPRLELTQPSP